MRLLLKLFIGGILLAVLIWKANFSSVIASLLSMPRDIVVISSICFVLTWFLAAYKWHALLPLSRYQDLLALSLIGQFYSWVLPGQIAGEVVKAFRLGRGQTNAEQLAMSVMIDKLTGLIGLLFVAAVGLLFSQGPVSIEVSIAISLLTILLLACLWSVRLPMAYRIFAALIDRAANWSSQLNRLASRLRQFLDGWRYYVLQPFRLIYAIFLGAVLQLSWVAITMGLAQGLGIDLPFFDWCWIFGLVSVALLLPVTIGGLGVREGAFVGALSLHGIPVEKSIALSLSGFAISLLIVLIGGLLELFRNTKPSA